jgi:hypothetical protein
MASFPETEQQALLTLGWGYNPFTGMNILRLRDRLVEQKEPADYTKEELSEMYLAGLALHYVGLVRKTTPEILWAPESELPDGLWSPTLLENARSLIRLGHPVLGS